MISSRFAVGIHILSLLEVNKNGMNTSEFMASSVNTNAVVIRRITGMLKKAGLVEVHPGIAGAKLAKNLNRISLYDVYIAVETVRENDLFTIHTNPNPNCPVGKNIQGLLEPIFFNAQLAMEIVLKKITLQDIVKNILSN